MITHQNPLVNPAERLPNLRGNLRLFVGPPRPDGSPSWSLFDPVRQQFFRLGWLEHGILANWHFGTMDSILQNAQRATHLPLTLEHIQSLLSFLQHNHLLDCHHPRQIQLLVQRYQSNQGHRWSWLFHHYLFFRIPLLRPDPLLKIITPRVGFIFTRGFFLTLVVVCCCGVFLVSRQWEWFQATFMAFLTLDGLPWMTIAIFSGKIIHELGHALTASHFGCRIPSMGIAFLVLWPVLYTDTTDAWKLTSRQQRLAIAGAGILAEMALAAIAIFLWNVLPQGILQSSMALLATVTLGATLMVNLNPLMRFDGYYLLADYLDIANLQERSFAFGRWHLREFLFGFGEEPPERTEKPRLRFLVLLAYATWIYRALLFLAIAAMVYHLTFKLAGIFLAVLEVAWFITRPTWQEWLAWWQRRGNMRLNYPLIRSILAVSLLLGAAILPWRGYMVAPALLKAEESVQIYPPIAARIAKVLVSRDQHVQQGELLVMLESPDLARKLFQIEEKMQTLEWEISHFAGRSFSINANRTLQKEWMLLKTEQQGLRQQQNRLEITAPFAGVVVDLLAGLSPGRWCALTTKLMTIINPNSAIVEGFIPEAAIEQIQPGATGIFLPTQPLLPTVPVHLIDLESTAIESLPSPILASTFGGPIGTRTQNRDTLTPVEATYRLVFKPAHPDFQVNAVLGGTVKIPAQPRSFFERAWQLVVAVLIRESGF